MKDRLQFRHHDAIFNTREDAINYITNDIRYSEKYCLTSSLDKQFSLCLISWVMYSMASFLVLKMAS